MDVVLVLGQLNEITNMIIDEKTQSFYLSESHKKNSELAQESLKKQKPFTREEMKAQYLRLKQEKTEEINLTKGQEK